MRARRCRRGGCERGAASGRRPAVVGRRAFDDGTGRWYCGLSVVYGDPGYCALLAAAHHLIPGPSTGWASPPIPRAPVVVAVRPPYRVVADELAERGRGVGVEVAVGEVDEADVRQTAERAAHRAAAAGAERAAGEARCCSWWTSTPVDGDGVWRSAAASGPTPATAPGRLQVDHERLGLAPTWRHTARSSSATAAGRRPAT